MFINKLATIYHIKARKSALPSSLSRSHRLGLGGQVAWVGLCGKQKSEWVGIK